MSPCPEPVTIAVSTSLQVSGLWQRPPAARATMVLAHGAGAGMTHPFLADLANALALHDVATLRYQFPFMERGTGRPDAPALAQATVRAAVAEAGRRAPTLALFAGGKSFGGRMTSQAHAAAPLAEVRGLIFLGFPWHPAGKPSLQRASHLASVRLPLLFLQGTRDKLAEWSLVQPFCHSLADQATLVPIEQGDHAFHVPVRSGRTDAEVLKSSAQVMSDWMRQHA